MTSADDVVQAFNLPKFQHAVVPSASLAPFRSSTLLQAEMDVSLPAKDNVMQRASDNGEASFTPVDDADVWEEIVPVAPVIKPSANGAVPRTMRELAEDAERTQPSSDFEDAYGISSHSTLRTPAGKPKRAHMTDQASPRGSKEPSQKTKGKRRTRKRTRDEDTESERDGYDVDPSSSSPSKRTKSAPGNPASASTRVLRARPTKTEARQREEREMEEAYRRAVAE